MKLLKSICAVALCASAFVFAGCKTVTDANGVSTRVVDSNKVDRAAVILRNVVADAAAVGEQLDPGSVVYLRLAVGVLDEAISSGATGPAALRKAITALPIAELDNPWARIGINNGLGAYEIFFQEQLAGAIGGNYAAVTLLTAFRDGIASVLPQSP
jgi:hypothetical protein